MKFLPPASDVSEALAVLAYDALLCLLSTEYDLIHWKFWTKTRPSPAHGLCLTNLPEEMLVEIMKNLEWDDILTIRQCCRSLYRLSRERSIWVHIFQRYSDTVFAQPFFLPKPLECCSSEVLENRVVSWWSRWKKITKGSYDVPRHSFDEKAIPNLTGPLLPLPSGHYLYASPDGTIFHGDLCRPGLGMRMFIPSPFAGAAFNVETRVSIDLHSGRDTGAYTSGFPTIFSIAVTRQPGIQLPGVVEIWKVTSELAVLTGYSSRLCQSITEDSQIRIGSCSILGEHVAYMANTGTSNFVAVVDWTVARAGEPQALPRKYIPRITACDKLFLLPAQRIFILSSGRAYIWDWGHACPLTTSVIEAASRPWVSPQWESPQSNILSPNPLSMPYRVRDCTRIVLPCPDHVLGVSIPNDLDVDLATSVTTTRLSVTSLEGRTRNFLWLGYTKAIYYANGTLWICITYGWPDDETRTYSYRSTLTPLSARFGNDAMIHYDEARCQISVFRRPHGLVYAVLGNNCYDWFFGGDGPGQAALGTSLAFQVPRITGPRALKPKGTLAFDHDGRLESPQPMDNSDDMQSRTQSSACRLLRLPHEILVEIMKRLEWRDVLAIRRCSHFFHSLSKEREVWVAMLENDLDTRIPRPFHLPKPLEHCSSEDLERRVVDWWSGWGRFESGSGRTSTHGVNSNSSSDEARDERGFDTRTYTFDEPNIPGLSGPLLPLPSNQYFLYAGSDGTVFYADPRQPELGMQVLLPSPFAEIEIEESVLVCTYVSVDVLGAGCADVGGCENGLGWGPEALKLDEWESTTQTLFPRTFRLAVARRRGDIDGGNGMSGVIEIWDIDSQIADCTGVLTGYSARLCIRFREDQGVGVNSCSILGRYVAYGAYSPVGCFVAIVDWTSIRPDDDGNEDDPGGSDTGRSFTRTYVPSVFVDNLLLLPDKNLLVQSIPVLFIWDWGGTCPTTTSADEAAEASFISPLWACPELRFRPLHPFTTPFVVRGCTRLVLPSMDRVVGLTIHPTDESDSSFVPSNSAGDGDDLAVGCRVICADLVDPLHSGIAQYPCWFGYCKGVSHHSDGSYEYMAYKWPLDGDDGFLQPSSTGITPLQVFGDINPWIVYHDELRRQSLGFFESEEGVLGCVVIDRAGSSSA
ncbi:hypothetical protein CC1G_13796 [Coprinopsis cinerea okayama7|uniref:F-box domain-containing protein n=1 Tax=Coprinopsis cinerea (strain Okayama-7 / 130 / ATCC MYA-4618 / FGSC 9003) TaxID=240176 RepID=D6RKA4_COPC7|nr:hypothetical protein CC1G_13796 [Coprinopsis cinerea okayama7\|eukprot:XP_002912265.1 hypothetical protein CC1G_13796 [Coprinopsis cinerea okayama7\